MRMSFSLSLNTPDEGDGSLRKPADQICYAVLCVFSYLAAGQEQKKQILQQAAKGPSRSEEASKHEEPVGTPPMTTSPAHSKPSHPVVQPSEGESEKVSTPSHTQSAVIKSVLPERASSPGAVPPPKHPPPPLIPPRQPSIGGSVSREGSLKGRPVPSIPHEPAVRQMSQGSPPAIPPRKPPPPSMGRHNTMPDPQDTRSPVLTRSQGPVSQFSTTQPPTTTTSPVAQSAQRRMPQRQGSISGPFSGVNPFVTSQRATEFVIPQRRPSMSRQSSQTAQDIDSPPSRKR